jgi:hypothetical protein
MKQSTTNQDFALSLFTGALFSSFALPLETAIYLFANLMDLVMTVLLLNTGMFYESNPMADFVLDHWGWEGMVNYKFSLVAVVVFLSQVIAAKRLRTARRLLLFATLVVSGVVVYSMGLFAQI